MEDKEVFTDEVPDTLLFKDYLWVMGKLDMQLRAVPKDTLGNEDELLKICEGLGKEQIKFAIKAFKKVCLNAEE